MVKKVKKGAMLFLTCFLCVTMLFGLITPMASATQVQQFDRRNELLGEWEGTYTLFHGYFSNYGINGLRLSIFMDGANFRAIVNFFPVQGSTVGADTGSYYADVRINPSTGEFEIIGTTWINRPNSGWVFADFSGTIIGDTFSGSSIIPFSVRRMTAQAGYDRWTSNPEGTPVRHYFYQEHYILHRVPNNTQIFVEYFIINTRGNKWYRTSYVPGLGRGVFWIYSGNLLVRPIGFYDRTILNEPLMRSDGMPSQHFTVADVVCAGPYCNCRHTSDFPFDPVLVTLLDSIANSVAHLGQVVINQPPIGAPPVRRGFRGPAPARYTGSYHSTGHAADISIQGRADDATLDTLYYHARRYGALMHPGSSIDNPMTTARSTRGTNETYIDRNRNFVHVSIPRATGAHRMVFVNSPVDIHVYNSNGLLVGRIINNVAQTIAYDGIYLYVYEGIKYMYVFSDRAYSIRFIATGYGTMMYALQDFNISTNRSVANRWFENVQLRPGMEFVSELTNAPNVQLLLVENGRVVGEVATDGSVTAVGQPVPPTTTPQPFLRFVIGQIQYTHHGAVRTSDAAPFISDDRTMVPLRIIAEALGADVGWNHNTQAVSIAQGGITLWLTIGTPLPGGMGTPVIVNARTFVPARYVSEMLGASVRWDPTNRAVYIYQTTGDRSPAVTPPASPILPIPPIPEAQSNPANVNVSTESELRNALTGEATIITLVNDITILRSISIDHRVPITITGNYSINLREDSREMININNTHVIWDGPRFNGTVNVNDGATLTIHSGGIRWLHGDRPTSSIVMHGGMVHGVRTSGNFIMRGGEIYLSWPRDGRAINLSGVAIFGGNFTMYGGTIFAGYTCGNMSGVLIGHNGGSFNMYAGTIRGFERGVVIDGRSGSAARFILQNGTITASNVGLHIGRGFSGVIELRGGRISGAVNDIVNLSDDIPTPQVP